MSSGIYTKNWFALIQSNNNIGSRYTSRCRGFSTGPTGSKFDRLNSLEEEKMAVYERSSCHLVVLRVEDKKVGEFEHHVLVSLGVQTLCLGGRGTRESRQM